MKKKFVVLGRFVLTRNTIYGESNQVIYGVGEAAVLLMDAVGGDTFMLKKRLDGSNYITGEEIYLVPHNQCYHLGNEGYEQSDCFRPFKSYSKELIEELEALF